jgi:hypothetical protein
MSFLSELQPRGFLRTILDVICKEYLPDLDQLLLERFLVNIDKVGKPVSMTI